MPGAEYVLVVATYPSAQQALRDLRDARRPGPVGQAVAGAAILDRTGSPAVLQGGGTLAYSIGTGAAAGIVVGVLASLPLLGAAAGAAVGALVGGRLGQQDVDGFVRLLGDAVVPGSAGLLAVVEADWQDEVSHALDGALRVSGRVLDDGPLSALAASLVRGNPVAAEALHRQRRRR